VKFAKQKFSIFVCFFALPFLMLFALVEDPVVSSSLLRAALGFARIRGGVHVDAQSWKVSPVLFSVSLEQLKFRWAGFSLRADKISVQVSPLSLLLGKISLTEANISGGLFTSNTKLLTGSSKSNPSESFEVNDIPRSLGREYSKILNELRAKNLSFETLAVHRVRIESQDLRIRELSVDFANLGSSQARASWDISGFSIKDQIAPVARLEGAAALLLRSGGNYSLTLGNCKVRIDDSEALNLEALGGFPGILNVSAKSRLPNFRSWALQSPALTKNFADPMAGEVELKATVELGAGQEIPLTAKLLVSGFSGFGVQLRSLDTSLSVPDLLTLSQKPRFEVKRGRAKFVEDFGSNRAWKNEVDFSGLRYDQDAVAGQLKFEQVGLCSLLESIGNSECFAGVGLDGGLQIQGALSPLEVRGSLDLKILPGPVGSDPLAPGEDSTILNVKPASLTGTVQIKDDRLHLDSVQMIFDESNSVDLAGDVNFSPTIVRIKARSNSLKLQSVSDEIVGLGFRGTAEIDSDINYDQRLPRVERTRVINRLKISQFGMDGEVFGSVSGNLDYTEKSLRFGPFQIRSGGGVGRLSGALASREKGSYLDLELNLDRVEYKSSSDSTGRPYFRGFLTGGARMSGYTASHGDDGLGADIELVARNFDAFGIPFQKANLSGNYKRKVLNINSFRAFKDGAWLELSGELNPEGGSFIKFWSDKVPIKNVSIDPSLVIFDSGRVEVEGQWRPSHGWSMNGRLTELGLAGLPLPAGDLHINAEKDDFELSLDISNLLQFKLKSRETKPGVSRFSEMEATLRDKGLYAGFAYLGVWTKPRPLETRGEMAFRWTPDSGYLRTADLRIRGPVGETGHILDLVNVPGKQELSWNQRRIENNSLDWSGPTELRSIGAVGDNQMTLRGRVPAPLASLFIPGLTMIDGYFEGQATLPLSPDFNTLRLSGKIVNGSILLPGFYEPFTAITGRVSMQDAQIQLQDVQGSAGPGHVQISGVYKLDSVKSGAALQADFQQARTLVLEDVPVDLTGSVTMTGQNPPYLLSGRLTVANALYSKEFKSQKAAPPPSLLIKKSEFLKFNVDLEITSSCRIANSLISSNVLGDLRITGSELDPLVGGEIDLREGSIFANQNEFRISHGRVYIPANPNEKVSLNLRAQTETKYSTQTYRIEMNARGPVDNLEIDLTSDPPLSHPDIVSLLAFGVIRDDEKGNLTSDQLFSAAQAEAFQSVFGKALGSSINKSTGFQVRLLPGQAQQAGNETLPNVSVVRKISDKVTAKFGRSLNLRNPEKDFQVDYKLMKNVNLSGVWENQEENKTSLGVDLRFHLDVK
jgi:hypothetical protein